MIGPPTPAALQPPPQLSLTTGFGAACLYAGKKGSLVAALFVWPLIGNALLNHSQRPIMLRYSNEAISRVAKRANSV
jgi:hypothetical protein